MDSTVLGIVISAIFAIGVPATIYFWKKHLVGSFLTVRFEFSRGLSSPQGVLIPHIDVDGFGVKEESIVRHHLTWTYNVTITNNSDHTAYFPRLYFKNDLFPDIEIEKIEELQPIGSKESIVIEVKFFEVSDTKPTQRKRTDSPPENFNSLKLLLEYYNSQHSKFYTLYDNSDKLNNSSKMRPKF